MTSELQWHVGLAFIISSAPRLVNANIIHSIANVYEIE